MYIPRVPLYLQKAPPTNTDKNIKIAGNNPRITSEYELENITDCAQTLANIFSAIGIDLAEE